MNRKKLIDAIGLLLIALVVVVGYKLSPLLLPRADVTVQPDPGCDLNRAACRVTLPGGGRLHLERLGAKLETLTPAQSAYLNIDAAGPYKPDHYRY